MDFFKIENFWPFVFLFLPGFISIKVYHSMVASDRYDFSKNLMELVGYSLLNLVLNVPLILCVVRFDWIYHRGFAFYLSGIWFLLISPIAWPLLVKYLMSTRLAKRYLLGNKKSAWDFYFSQRTGCWVIVNLKNGSRVGGNYSEHSYATSYPCGESLYLEEVWELWDKAEGGKFKHKVDSTAGVLLMADTIESIEFYN